MNIAKFLSNGAKKLGLEAFNQFVYALVAG